MHAPAERGANPRLGAAVQAADGVRLIEPAARGMDVATRRSRPPRSQPRRLMPEIALHHGKDGHLLVFKRLPP
jgi:hypothetical protein